MQENNSSAEIAPQFGGSTVEESAPVIGVKEVSEPVEEKKAEAPQVVEQDQKFAARFAALSRKEKQMREQESKLQQQMQELQAKLQAFEEQQKTFEPFKTIPDRLKREPVKVLKEQGFTPEQLAEMILNDGDPTPDMKMSEYEKKISQKLEEMEKKIAEKEAKEQEEKYAAAVESFKSQLVDFINKDETYELIKANDGADLVFEVIEAHHNETGQILSNKEACDAVEEHFLEEARKLVDREKVKKLLQPTTPKTQPAGAGKPSPTLSNVQAAQTSQKPSRKLSDEESKAEAAKLLKWND